MSELRVSASEAAAALGTQIAAGVEFLAVRPSTIGALAALTREYQQWSGANRDALRRLFTTADAALEYSAFHGSLPPDNPAFDDAVTRLHADIALKIERLRTIVGRLAGGAVPGAAGDSDAGGRKVFLARGREASVNESVKRFLRALELDVVEVAEIGHPVSPPPDSYAVVVLAPGDGASNGDEENRAATESESRNGGAVGGEQLDVFLESLGRGHVAALRAEGSRRDDLAGVFSIPLDAGGAWKLLLARELRRAGLALDLHRALTP